MSRYLVTGRFSVEVRATDEDEAQDKVEDLAGELNMYCISVECLSPPAPPPPPAPYSVPPGVGEWGPLLAAGKIAETKHRSVGEWDGSWWWSNGHFALRVEGPCVPENGGGIYDFGHVVRADLPRQAADWADAGDNPKAYRSGSIGISRQYRELIEAGAPGCSWWIGERHEPILAKDAGGRIVAVVMPVTL